MKLCALNLDKGATTFQRHLIFRRQRRSFKGKALVATLMLTSMVDMFSMLVCFMLQTFSSSPETLITKGIDLPDAKGPSMVKEAPLVSLSEDGVYVDQVRVGKIKQVLRSPRRLTAPLVKVRRDWVRKNPGEPFPGEVNLQAHRRLSSAVVSQIMGILTGQYYNSIQLAVISGGGGD